MSLQSGTIFDIKKYAINDGPGIRTVVFFQGCPLNCWWCHNPEGISPQPRLMYRLNRCTLCGTCVTVCPQNAIHMNGMASTDRSKCDDCGICCDICYNNAREMTGRVMTVSQVMAEIERDVPFYDQSGGGVTFSGGEPLFQSRFLRELLLACRAHDIHTTVDTSGYASWETLESVREYVNLFLYDLKLINDDRHIHYTGVSNRLILRNLQRLSQSGHSILVRIPLIPGVNDDEDNLRQSGSFLSTLPRILGVELISYHHLATAKYEALGLSFPLSETLSPNAEEMQHSAVLLSEFGLTVKVI